MTPPVSVIYHFESFWRRRRQRQRYQHRHRHHRRRRQQHPFVDKCKHSIQLGLQISFVLFAFESRQLFSSTVLNLDFMCNNAATLVLTSCTVYTDAHFTTQSHITTSSELSHSTSRFSLSVLFSSHMKCRIKWISDWRKKNEHWWIQSMWISFSI